VLTAPICVLASALPFCVASSDAGRLSCFDGNIRPSTAQDQQGRWIVIECNDGQESGYAGVSPIGMWQHIVEIERKSLLEKNEEHQ
jgi:hypothetical protein